MTLGRCGKLWRRLIELLDNWAATEEAGPGRLIVRVPRGGAPARTVEIVMTPEEWDDMVNVLYGDFDDAAARVRSDVLALPERMRFLVYENYALVPSATPELAPDPEELRLLELARQHPEGFGRWVAHADADTNHLGSMPLAYRDLEHPGPDNGRTFAVEVDGEQFAVDVATDPWTGHTDTAYTWLSGPNKDYGFGVGGPRTPSLEDHERAIREFLAMVDPTTGFIEDD